MTGVLVVLLVVALAWIGTPIQRGKCFCGAPRKRRGDARRRP